MRFAFPPYGLPTCGGPYLDKPVPKDPWGRSYLHILPGEHWPYDLYSLGPTGQPGGKGENAPIAIK